jgi:hypothetical protein
MRPLSISLAPHAPQPGLQVKAKLDTRYYEAGVKITDEEMESINLQTHRTNPEWNYTISPLGQSVQK